MSSAKLQDASIQKSIVYLYTFNKESKSKSKVSFRMASERKSNKFNIKCKTYTLTTIKHY